MRIFLMIPLIASLSWGQPASIEAFPMPTAPARRFDVQVREKTAPEAELWYHRYGYYLRGEEEIRHGVEVERIRMRDRERHATEFKEVRHVWDEGARHEARVESLYQEGVLRQRDYIATAEVRLTVLYNADGQEIREPGRHARGGLRVRERITSQFDTIFELKTP